MRLRMFGALTLAFAVASGFAPLTAAQAATAPQLTPGSSPTEFYVASGNGASVGEGVTIDDTSPTVTVSSDLTTVTASSASGWQLTLQSTTALTTGTTYPTGISVTQNSTTCSSGSFTLSEFSASDVNATFSLECPSSVSEPDVVGFLRFNATQTTPFPNLPTNAQPITDPPNSGTTSANADEFNIQGASGNEFGIGAPEDYTGSNVSVSGNSSNVTLTAGSFSAGNEWTWSVGAPQGQQLEPGTYPTAGGVPPISGAGINLTSNGTGCDTYYGSFTIYQITANPDGTLAQFNATFAFTCEQATNPGVVGYVRFNATTPTPVASVLTAPLNASSGVAASNGQTEVTLDASASNATAGASYSFDFGDGAQPTVSATPTATRAEWEGTYEVTVTVTDAGQTTTSAPQWFTVGDGYQAVTPQRILDTRASSQVGPFTGPISEGSSITLTLPSSVTANSHGPVEAVALNVTVTGATSGGDIAVYSTGLPQTPTTSNINYAAGQTIANLVTVALEPGAQVVFSVQGNPGSVQLIADLEGYYVAGNDPTNLGYQALSPTRLVDTRSDLGGIGGRMTAGEVARFTLPSSVPAGAGAVAFNVTAVNTSAPGNIKVYPDSGTVPNISNVNFDGGDTVPNLVIVPIPASRVIDFDLESSSSADLIVDLQGYFSTSAAAKFVPSFPTRLFDTRTNFLPGPMQSGEELIDSMAFILQVPTSTLNAALYNVTVTQPQGPGNIIVAPDPVNSLPITSNVNFSANETIANSVLGTMTDGDQDYINDSASPVQLISDFFGYYGLPLATTGPPTSPSAEKAQTSAKTRSTAVTVPAQQIASRAKS